MFDALNGHFGDDIEWVVVAYLPIIIRCSFNRIKNYHVGFCVSPEKYQLIRKNIFACLCSVHNISPMMAELSLETYPD